MPYMKVRGINMYYEVYGEGSPLVMIMGLSANKDWWPQPLLEKLSDNYKVVVFDNRGSGRSDKPDIPYSIKMFADDTVGLMDSLGIDIAYIFGVSMGGMIAQEIALNYPEKVEKLILGCTACNISRMPLPSQDLVAMNLEALLSEGPRKYAKEYVIPTLFAEETIEKQPELIDSFIDSYSIAPIPAYAYKRQFEAILEYDVCSRLNEIRMPTLILQGSEDVLIPPENAKILSELIPNSKLIIFKNTGHAFIAEALDEVYKVILEFLEE